MSRYLLGAILALIGFMTLYGIGSSQETARRTTGASRDAVSVNSNNADTVASIEDAGRGVSRQFTSDGRPIASTPTTIQQDSTTADDAAVEPVSPGAETPTQNVTPVTPAQTDREAIPALW